MLERETMLERRIRLVLVPATLLQFGALVVGVLVTKLVTDDLLGLPSFVVTATNFVVGVLIGWHTSKIKDWLSNLEKESRAVPPEPNIRL